MATALKMENIVKKFGDFTANDGISVEVEEGEIRAILGENGAGKTTLMNILYGLYRPTSGSIRLYEEEMEIESPMQAIKAGIGMIHQHFMLISAFTVLENVILGLKSDRAPFLDVEKARNQIIETAKANDLTVDPDALISDLSVGQQQQVEILKALYRGAKILILDEPTAVLTPRETEKLFVTLRSLAEQGHTILFISHKLNEVLAVSDRITVLRKGKKISTVKRENVTKDELAELMVGRECELSVQKDPVEEGNVLLEVDHVCITGRTLASSIKNVSFEVKEGQIVGIAGVDGNGQSELIEGLAGLRSVDGGRIQFRGKNITNETPLEILEEGIALVPEDRNEVGSIGRFNLVENTILRSYYKEPYRKGWFIDYKAADDATCRLIEEFDVRAASRKMNAISLSGGNLQKLIMGREIDSDPKLLLAMHPTRGLDVGAIEFVHKRLLDLRRNKRAVLLVSTELDEILDLSDVVIVLYNGEVTGIVEGGCAERENVGRMMLGETGTDIDKKSGSEVRAQ